MSSQEREDETRMDGDFWAQQETPARRFSNDWTSAELLGIEGLGLWP